MSGFCFLEEIIALWCQLHWALDQENLDVHSWIIFCPYGIIPDSVLTGPNNTHTHTHTHTRIYIYIYIYKCACVCLVGQQFSSKHVWLNNIDTFCLYNFTKIFSSFLISVLVSRWNWWTNLPKLSYERSESDRDNFGKFIHQFQLKTKTLIRKLERILIKWYRQNVPLLFNQTYTHIHIYMYMYI